MTIQGLVWAWEQEGLTAREKLVLLALGDGSSDHSPPPDLRDVAKRSDITMTELDEVLEVLQERGLIDTDNRTIER